MGIKRGQELEVEIESLAYGGKGVAHVDGFTIFVERALPGQLIRIRIKKKRTNYAEAYPVEILTPAPNQVEAQCPHFGVCGGCLLQNMSYPDQLAVKTTQVKDLLERVGGFRDIPVKSALPSPEIFHYRNKMEFSFTRRPWMARPDDPMDDFGLGLHVPGRFDRVLPLDVCYLQKPICTDILNFTSRWAKEHQWEPFDTKTHTGWARHLVLRYGEHTDEIMVNLVTRTHDPDLVEPYFTALKEKFPPITVMVNNTTRSRAEVAIGEAEYAYSESRVIHDRLGELTYEIAANAFFQTNTRQAERLYAETLAQAQLTGKEVVYDLYCGTGTIALYLAQYAQKVIGVEVVEDAVENARANAASHGITNAEFILGDLKDVFRKDESAQKLQRPDVLVVDPPRAGLHPKLIDDIIWFAPQRIVYVSCNPSTLARDLKLLCTEDRYEITSVQPVDMFPHTAHIETVVGMEKK
ncbi:MAG: 23S rRNA (uracil(1939)-C(5))-methyltransferase RlmD [Lentisphaeria bacterium]|nr:23S rRNA (uracil(1939)-C(5))-methyltransferase RlmD [Candidatus Neomarinimicrobiota bacterium]MCF7841274.1 23S rRNA (uracil(1939)-C(5))-methyltransferase RlmD [Lentisphaeria bacterium]